MNDQQQLQQRISELEKKVNNLYSAGDFPLEVQNAILGRGFLKFDKELTYIGGADGAVFKNIFVNYSGKKSLISVSDIYSFYVNTTSNTVFIENNPAPDGTNVIFYTTGATPGGLDSPSAVYTVRDSTSSSFKLSTDGGTNTVDITDAGTGVQYVQFF